MKTMRLNDAEPKGALVEDNLPIPRLGPDEVLIRVYATGVTPTEVLWYPTTHTKTGEPRRHAVPGHEFSGVIEEVGIGVTGLSVGQPVYGLNDWFAEGATAEYCLTQPSSIASKPQHLSHPEAASVPIGALTAWQGLFDRAKLRAGERVLIHGGAGAVGLLAIQLARRAGAQVFTTASARNAELLTNLGAERVIDYHTERFEDYAQDIDVVFDGVGGDILKRSWNILKPAGRLVTIAAESEGTKDARTEAAFFIVEPNQSQLVEIANLLDQGALKTHVAGVVPLTQASFVYFGGRENGKAPGKWVIEVVEEGPR